MEVQPDTLESLGKFQAIAAGNESKVVDMEVLIIRDSTGEPIPSSEVEEIMWIDSKTTGIQLGSIFAHDVIPMLK